jgi:uncharacterized membrane protein (UPF0127 family)
MTVFSRARGLAFDDEPRVLLLERCRSVHTFGMRYALDLYWLRGERIVRVDRDVGPGQVRTCLRAKAVLEVPSG